VSTAGLRERKKQKTKEAIQREAMRLFKRQGYADTTIEQIAAAAEISPSTFFNYFPTKEDVVIYDRYDPMVFAMLLSAPAGESLSKSIDRVFEGLAGIFVTDREIILERGRLSLEVPELRGRIWEELEKARDLFAEAIGQRLGRDASDFEVQVAAMTLIGVAFQAMIEWLRHDGRGNMLDLFKQALSFVQFGELLDSLEKRAS
jgi:AcrR family transcriptional regulator